MLYRVRPRHLFRLGQQYQICRPASSSTPKNYYPRYSEKGLRRVVGSLPKPGGRKDLPQLEKDLVNNTPQAEQTWQTEQEETEDVESSSSLSSSEDQRALESASLLEKYGLSTIPENESESPPGVEIDKFGQLSITSEADSRRKRKTALILSRASPSLAEYDFRKLLGAGKHIDGWRGQGGLEKSKPPLFQAIDSSIVHG